jgi:hypothetical protein
MHLRVLILRGYALIVADASAYLHLRHFSQTRPALHATYTAGVWPSSTSSQQSTVISRVSAPENTVNRNCIKNAKDVPTLAVFSRGAPPTCGAWAGEVPWGSPTHNPPSWVWQAARDRICHMSNGVHGEDRGELQARRQRIVPSAKRQRSNTTRKRGDFPSLTVL